MCGVVTRTWGVLHGTFHCRNCVVHPSQTLICKERMILSRKLDFNAGTCGGTYICSLRGKQCIGTHADLSSRRGVTQTSYDITLRFALTLTLSLQRQHGNFSVSLLKQRCTTTHGRLDPLLYATLSPSVLVFLLHGEYVLSFQPLSLLSNPPCIGSLGYQGCYYDKKDDRIMGNRLKAHGMTIEVSP